MSLLPFRIRSWNVPTTSGFSGIGCTTVVWAPNFCSRFLRVVSQADDQAEPGIGETYTNPTFRPLFEPLELAELFEELELESSPPHPAATNTSPIASAATSARPNRTITFPPPRGQAA